MWLVKYDLILDAFFLERRLFDQMVKALRPHGLLVIRTLMRRASGEDRNPAHLLEPTELRTTFAALELLAWTMIPSTATPA